MTEYFIPTLNQMGYQTTKFDVYTEKFIQYAVETKDQGYSLELGAGYGFAAKEIAEKGGRIYCNDLEEEHLKDIKSLFPDRLKVVGGSIFTIDLPKSFFEAILISRVIHFFTPEELSICLERFKDWLKPGGKLFITAETPYLSNWTKFIPIFEGRKKAGDPHPGLIGDPYAYESSGLVKNLPEYKRKFDVDTLSAVLREHGFEIEEVSFINRSGTFPPQMLLDGRESVGAIARRGAD